MGGGKKQIKAQAAIELAVFGAVLIFVIGAIIKQSLAVGYWQNQNLKAMRLALKASYDSQMAGDIASRRRASVLFVEDRLTADSAKYGAIDRTPHMVEGSGAHNRNLFMPVDFPDCEDLPVMDVIVNGKRFVFTMAGFRTVSFTTGTDNSPLPIPDPQPPVEAVTGTKTDSCGGAPQINFNGQWDPYCLLVTTTSPCTPVPANCDGVSISCSPADYCAPFCPDYANGCGIQCTAPGPSTCASWCPNIASGCVVQCTGPTDCDSSCAGFGDADSPCSVNKGFSLARTDSYYKGCLNFYTILDNHPLISGWCATCDERFDLDRGLTNLNRGGIPTPDVVTVNRSYFAWQWSLVRGVNVTASENSSVDLDMDLQLEDVMLDSLTGTSFEVMDPNDGDVDFSGSEENSIKPLPGFTKDTRMYTFVRDRASGGSGTYFRVEEGKLFSPTGNQFIRTARKKDQIDVIERVFQLSNNTGRYCDSSGNLVTWGSTPATKGEGMAGLSNPVEVCNNCFTTANISRTCMDTANLLIFIRSRIEDLHGRKWVTDTSGDPYVNFMSPAGY